jgi:hypothetical protein
VMRPLEADGATQILLMGHRRLRITSMVNYFFLSGFFICMVVFNIESDHSNCKFFFSRCIDCVVNVPLNMDEAGD